MATHNDRPYRADGSHGHTVYRIDEDYASPFLTVRRKEDAPFIVEALNKHHARRTAIRELTEHARKVADERTAVAVNACAVVEDDDADDGDAHRSRASELLDDARAYFLRAVGRQDLSEAERGDAVLRVRLLTGLAYGHALLAKEGR